MSGGRTGRAGNGAGADVARLRELLHEAGAMLAESRAMLDRGEAPDLAPVVPMIDSLTRDIALLADGEGRPLRPALLALLDEMGRLGQRLVEERDRLGRQLRARPAHERAHAAYRGRDKA
jgi:hypothetical protein